MGKEDKRETRKAHSVLVTKPLGKRLLSRPRRKRECNMNMNHGKTNFQDNRWIEQP
jgi:hypothetical protein